MIRRRTKRGAAGFVVNFVNPQSLGSISIHLELARGNIKNREYVVTVRGFMSGSEQALSAGGWNHSPNLNAKFCYVPEAIEPAIVKLPPVTIGQSVTSLVVEAHEWVGAAVPVGEVIASVWVVVPDPPGGSHILKSIPRSPSGKV